MINSNISATTFIWEDLNGELWQCNSYHRLLEEEKNSEIFFAIIWLIHQLWWNRNWIAEYIVRFWWISVNGEMKVNVPIAVGLDDLQVVVK